MNMINALIILFFAFILQCSAKVLIPSDLNVKITCLAKCTRNAEYPVEIYDVDVNTKNGKITVTGTLTSLVDLASPVKASLEVKREELGIWIEIPCVDSIGSCTYNDLCVYGVPSSESCPQNFVDNNVPCRCPILKGNYTIPSSIEFDVDPNSITSVFSGTYWAKVNIMDNNKNVACYEVKFVIGDSTTEDENVNVDYSNYWDRIFVVLV